MNDQSVNQDFLNELKATHDGMYNQILEATHGLMDNLNDAFIQGKFSDVYRQACLSAFSENDRIEDFQSDAHDSLNITAYEQSQEIVINHCFTVNIPTKFIEQAKEQLIQGREDFISSIDNNNKFLSGMHQFISGLITSARQDNDGRVTLAAIALNPNDFNLENEILFGHKDDEELDSQVYLNSEVIHRNIVIFQSTTDQGVFFRLGETVDFTLSLEHFDGGTEDDHYIVTLQFNHVLSLLDEKSKGIPLLVKDPSTEETEGTDSADTMVINPDVIMSDVPVKILANNYYPADEDVIESTVWAIPDHGIGIRALIISESVIVGGSVSWEDPAYVSGGNDRLFNFCDLLYTVASLRNGQNEEHTSARYHVETNHPQYGAYMRCEGSYTKQMKIGQFETQETNFDMGTLQSASPEENIELRRDIYASIATRIDDVRSITYRTGLPVYDAEI